MLVQENNMYKEFGTSLTVLAVDNKEKGSDKYLHTDLETALFVGCT